MAKRATPGAEYKAKVRAVGRVGLLVPGGEWRGKEDHAHHHPGQKRKGALRACGVWTWGLVKWPRTREACWYHLKKMKRRGNTRLVTSGTGKGPHTLADSGLLLFVCFCFYCFSGWAERKGWCEEEGSTWSLCVHPTQQNQAQSQVRWCVYVSARASYVCIVTILVLLLFTLPFVEAVLITGPGAQDCRNWQAVKSPASPETTSACLYMGAGDPILCSKYLPNSA